MDLEHDLLSERLTERLQNRPAVLSIFDRYGTKFRFMSREVNVEK
jgi:hypothetical protein